MIEKWIDGDFSSNFPKNFPIILSEATPKGLWSE